MDAERGEKPAQDPGRAPGDIDVVPPTPEMGPPTPDMGPSAPDTGPSAPETDYPEWPSAPDMGPSAPETDYPEWPSAPDTGPSAPETDYPEWPSAPDMGPSAPDTGPNTPETDYPEWPPADPQPRDEPAVPGTAAVSPPPAPRVPVGRAARRRSAESRQMARPIGWQTAPRRSPRFRYVLFALAILLIVGYFVVRPMLLGANSDLGAVLDEVRRGMSPNYVLLEEQRVDASSADADHPIALAFDGGTNTYWSTSEPQATITVEIPGTAHLAALILHPGVRGQPDAFRTPSKLELVSLDTGASVTIDVRSGVDRQDHTFDMPVTGRLEMRIVSTHGDASLPLAISEIELNAAE